MNLNVFTGELRPASEVFSELSNSMKLYESGEITYPELSKHLLVILGDISTTHGHLSERHLFVLSMVSKTPSRDNKEGYKSFIRSYLDSGGDSRKIPLIKELRIAFDMGLKEAKEAVEGVCVFDSDMNFINFKED